MHSETATLLEVGNLHTHFRTAAGLVRAMDGVSFSVERGSTLGIVGESGCGKSVLARTLLGLLPSYAENPGNARIVYAGRNLLHLADRDRRKLLGREMAIIFQDPMTTLNPVMKVGRQIGEGMVLHLGMSKAHARERSIELLAEVGIPQPETRIDQYPHQLSGGMRQRVAIAIALACEPKLLIADEPTTALDVTVQAEILDLLQREQQQRSMAMILISHDLGVVAGRCDAVAVMYAGKVVEYAPTEALFARTRMPYTQALLNSIPDIDAPPHTPLDSIGGRPPNLIDPPSGCRFAPRCTRADGRCRVEDPALQNDPRDPLHKFACWRPVAGGSAA